MTWLLSHILVSLYSFSRLSHCPRSHVGIGSSVSCLTSLSHLFCLLSHIFCLLHIYLTSPVLVYYASCLTSPVPISCLLSHNFCLLSHIKVLPHASCGSGSTALLNGHEIWISNAHYSITEEIVIQLYTVCLPRHLQPGAWSFFTKIIV